VARSLKTKWIETHPDRSVYATPMSRGESQRPVITIELFDVDGRRWLIPLTDRQAAQVSRTCARAFDVSSPDHPSVFDIEASRQRLYDRQHKPSEAISNDR
jgi:hypothetical protein